MRQDNHVNGRAIRHRWTDGERLTIALLRHLYDNSWDHCMDIWNDLYKQTLAREGFPASGLPLPTMQSQVADLKGSRARPTSWNVVTGLTISQARSRFAKQRNTIEKAAGRLNIRLKVRSHAAGTVALTTLAPVTRNPADVAPAAQYVQGAVVQESGKTSIITAHAHDWAESSSESDGHDQESPCLRRLNASLIRSYAFDATDSSVTQGEQTNAPISGLTSTTDVGRRLPPRLRLHLSGAPDSPSRAPALLFRAFLPGHGFMARKFLDIPDARVPPPPPFQSETFRERVEPHLREYQRENASYLSPFLSLAENPLNALKRITQSGLPLSFAIFYFQDVMDDGIARYGDLCQPYPFLCPTIVGEHDLDDLPGDYTGTGEWLAWGSIDCPPVAVFNRDEAMLLMRTLAAIKKIDASSGRALGQRLTSISDKYKELVAYKFLKSIKVRGYLQAPKSKVYHEFIDAVYDVARGNRAESVFSEYNHDTHSSSPYKSQAQVVVEVPASAQQASQQDQALTGGHRRTTHGLGISWQPVQQTPRGRRITVAVPRAHTDAIIEGCEDEGHVQRPLDARFQSETLQTPAPKSLSPTTAFFQQLQEAAVPTPPPVPPVRSTSRVNTASSFGSISSSGVVIVDLCDSEDDAEMSEPDSSPAKTQTQTRTQRETAIDDNDIVELPNVNLAQQQTFDATHDNAHNAQNTDDFEVIGTATHISPVPRMSMSTTLSIRSRSLSHTVSPQTIRNNARGGNIGRVRGRGREVLRARSRGDA